VTNILSPIQKFFALSLLQVVPLILCSTVAFAQHSGGSHSGGSGPPPSVPTPLPTQPSATTYDQNKLILQSQTKDEVARSVKNECFLPPLANLQMETVAVSELKIPEKAQNEYRTGCSAIRNKNFSEAEKHLRKAIQQYDKYQVAWVVLGQLLESQQKLDEAHQACTHAFGVGAGYVPAYLCAADISAHQQNWEDVLKMSGRSLEIDPGTNVIGYDYNAAANFNLHNLPKAEQSALRAIEIDRTNTDPRVHFLLAQIYEAQGDTTNEVAQLREYLKYATDPNDVVMVTSYLSTLDKQTKK
jgi:tetratricopeptide (TPR) repeat protein